MTTDPRLLVLSPEDNICVACRDLEAGAELLLDGEPVVLERAVPTGHKVARRPIRAGETVREVRRARSARPAPTSPAAPTSTPTT